MTNTDLAMSYIIKAEARIDILTLLIEKQDYSDVVREAQEIVELATKAMLRRVGIDPPKRHDVSQIIIDHQDRFPVDFHELLPRIAEISKALRKERELAFYGDIDFIPTEEYSLEDAAKAAENTRFVVEIAKRIVIVDPISVAQSKGNRADENLLRSPGDSRVP